jgi:hypothetical protein
MALFLGGYYLSGPQKQAQSLSLGLRFGAGSPVFHGPLAHTVLRRKEKAKDLIMAMFSPCLKILAV